jgi:hypothetical protein
MGKLRGKVRSNVPIIHYNWSVASSPCSPTHPLDVGPPAVICKPKLPTQANKDKTPVAEHQSREKRDHIGAKYSPTDWTCLAFTLDSTICADTATTKRENP